jgi:hypothetical protein
LAAGFRRAAVIPTATRDGREPAVTHLHKSEQPKESEKGTAQASPPAQHLLLDQQRRVGNTAVARMVGAVNRHERAREPGEIGSVLRGL